MTEPRAEAATEEISSPVAKAARQLGAFEPELNRAIEGVTYEQYDSSPGLRAGDLRLLLRSPAHYWAERSQPRAETQARRFGRIFHLSIQHREEFQKHLVVEPVFSGPTKDGKESTRSAAAKEKRDAWYAELPKTAVVVTEDECRTLTGMLNAVAAHPLLRNLLRDGVRETSVWAKDPETGVVLKCRPDVISAKHHVVDFKTTRDASEDFFLGQIYSSRFGSPFYVLSAAHYAHVCRVAGVARPDVFVFVALEKEPPYGIRVYTLDSGMLDVGEQKRRKLTRLFAECKKTGLWPGYEPRAVPALIPAYVKPDEEELGEWLDQEQQR